MGEKMKRPSMVSTIVQKLVGKRWIVSGLWERNCETDEWEYLGDYEFGQSEWEFSDDGLMTIHSMNDGSARLFPYATLGVDKLSIDLSSTQNIVPYLVETYLVRWHGQEVWFYDIDLLDDDNEFLLAVKLMPTT